MLANRATLFAALAALLSIGSAHALDQLVVGRAVATAATFTPLEIGEHAGIWKQNGIALKIISFNGDAQLRQALIAGTAQIGLGSGPVLAFLPKGVPAMAVAALGGTPYNICMVVAASSGIKSIQGPRSKQIGVTTLGSLSHWLVLETSQRYGWKGKYALVPVPLGSQRTQLAAMIRGQIAGYVTTAVEGFTDVLDGRGRIVLNYGDMITHFITHVGFASDELIARNPDIVRRLLLGWRQTIVYIGQQQALAVLSSSFTDLGILPSEPNLSGLYTNRFIPLCTDSAPRC